MTEIDRFFVIRFGIIAFDAEDKIKSRICTSFVKSMTCLIQESMFRRVRCAFRCRSQVRMGSGPLGIDPAAARRQPHLQGPARPGGAAAARAPSGRLDRVQSARPASRMIGERAVKPAYPPSECSRKKRSISLVAS